MPLTGLKYGVADANDGDEVVGMLLKGAMEVCIKPPGPAESNPSRMLSGRVR
jgi:hypothetical protein